MVTRRKRGTSPKESGDVMSEIMIEKKKAGKESRSVSQSPYHGS